MLKNETYAGTRYFNRITAATEASREGKQVIRGRWVYRDREGTRVRTRLQHIESLHDKLDAFTVPARSR